MLSEAEVELLKIIHAPVAPEARAYRDNLLAKHSQNILTEDEQATLSPLIDTVELANARRWQAIGTLAQQRECSPWKLSQTLESL